MAVPAHPCTLPTRRPSPPTLTPCSLSLWTHIGYARLAALLAERAGLHFAPNRQPAAEAGMRRVLLAERLADPLRLAKRAERDPEVLAAVLAEVTIGETYFFREPGQLDVIRDTVLPALRDRRSARLPLRVWSAGCATGEEPYTLAILLREAGWEGMATVLGTDLSRPRLAAAERARYTSWSMRGLAEERLDRYFLRRGKHFLLHPEIRAMVELRPLNLAEDSFPGGESGIGDMDVVLCRNVLIYFDRDTVAAVAGRLLASLSDDGWLFLGASDPMLTELVPCETVVTAAGLAYRRRRARAAVAVGGRRPAAALHTLGGGSPAATRQPDGATPLLQSLLPTIVAEPDVPAAAAEPGTAGDDATDAGAPDPTIAEARERYAARDYAAAATLAAAARARREDAAVDALLVRALANGGRVADAEGACLQALEAHPDDAHLAFLHAVLLAQRGQFGASAAAARRALYLDRSLAVAHLALGSALAREGHAALARRALRAAERLLAALPPDAPVPLADGEPAQRLLEAARAQERLLAEAVA